MNRMDEYTALLAELKQAPEELNHTVNKALDRKGTLQKKRRFFGTSLGGLAGLFAGMFVELTALFAIPFFLYRGLGLTGGSFWELVLVQCLVLVLSRIIMLPGNAGGAEGSFYLFMGPLFGRHLAVGLVLWRFAAFLEVLLLGGAWSVLRFAQRSAAGHGT